MKPIIKITFVFIILFYSCNVSKKLPTDNTYKGILFYSKGSPYFIFYATEKNKLSEHKIVKLIDNNYGYIVWFPHSRYMFAMEDVLKHFDSINYRFHDNPHVYQYTYVKANFNQPINSKLVDSIYREKAYNYMNLKYDEFLIDNREIKVDSLVFNNLKLNKEYIRLVEFHKGSIKAIHPPPPPQVDSIQ